MAKLELFGTRGLPIHAGDARLAGMEALANLWSTTLSLTPKRDAACGLLARAHAHVPVLVEDGKVVQIGWQGHGCMVEME